MEWYRSHKLIQGEQEDTLIIYLNPEDTEFSREILSNIKDNVLGLDEKMKTIIDKNYSAAKISTVKLVLGSLVVAAIPFAGGTKVQAQEVNSTMAAQALNATGVVTASKLNMRTGPGTNHSIMHVLWQGNRVKVIGQSNGWYRIQLSDSRTGWVSGDYLQVANDRQQTVNTVVNTARSLLGTPYVWGGESLQQGGFDCSGLTLHVYKQAGISLNRVSSDQAKQGVAVARQNIQPGDLLFYSFEGTSNINHVGIYIGNGVMIHSPKPGDTVKTANITTSYWESRLVVARRVIP